MKVYLVSTGEYSDCCNVGAFSTREKAVAFLAAFGGEEHCNPIEEFEVDALPMPPSGKTLFYVSRDADEGGRYLAMPHEPTGEQKERVERWGVTVWAESKEQAIELAKPQFPAPVPESTPYSCPKCGRRIYVPLGSPLSLDFRTQCPCGSRYVTGMIDPKDLLQAFKVPE